MDVFSFSVWEAVSPSCPGLPFFLCSISVSPVTNLILLHVSDFLSHYLNFLEGMQTCSSLVCIANKVKGDPPFPRHIALGSLFALLYRKSLKGALRDSAATISTWSSSILFRTKLAMTKPQLFSCIMLMIPILPDPRAMSWSDYFSNFRSVSKSRELKSHTLIVDISLSIFFFFLGSLNLLIKCLSITGYHDNLWKWLFCDDSFYLLIFWF